MSCGHGGSPESSRVTVVRARVNAAGSWLILKRWLEAVSSACSSKAS